MSKVYETLKKKNDTSVEVYPNIERQNIPNGAVNTDKIDDRAINYNKLNDALRQQSDDFDSIYNHENDKLSVSDIEVSDDIDCTNINASNKVTAYDIETSNIIKSPEYRDADDDELKVIVNHSIQAQLVNKDVPTDVRWIFMHFVSSHKEAFTTFSDLLNELSKKVNINIIDNANNVVGWIEAVNVNDGYVSIYVDDGNGGIESRDYGSANTITDTVYPI